MIESQGDTETERRDTKTHSDKQRKTEVKRQIKAQRQGD